MSIVVLPVRSSNRRRTIIDGLRQTIGIACHKVETKVERLFCFDRCAIAITLRNILEYIDTRVSSSLEHWTVVTEVCQALSLSQSLTSFSNIVVLNDHIVESLRVDTLNSPVDTKELEVNSKVCTKLLRELEVLIESIDSLLLLCRSCWINCWVSLISIISVVLNSDTVSIICIIRELSNTSVREVV